MDPYPGTGRRRDPAARESAMFARLPVAASLAAALVSGGLYGAALLPGASAALAGVALVPWLAVLVGASKRRALALGLLWSSAATLSAAFWFPQTLQSYFGVSVAASWLAWIALALLGNGIPCAAFAVWLAACTRRGRVAPVAVAAAFVVAEWLRAHGIVANPYASFGTALVETPLAQTADLLGTPLLTFWLVAVNAWIASIWVPRLRPSRVGALALGLALVCGVGYGLERSQHRFGDASSVAVAAIQPALPRATRAEAEHQLANVRHQLALSEAPAQEGRILFWPEAAVHTYLREESAARAALLERAAADGFELMLGGPHYRLVQGETRYFSSAFLLRDGALAGRYDKQRLVPFSEASPWPALGGLAPPDPYTPGPGPRLLSTSGFELGVFLCGELLFGEVARGLVAAGATVLANPSNDDWFGHPVPAAHQLAVARLRAIENRRPVVRPTTNGSSAIIDARGALVARSTTNGPEVLRAELRPSNATTLAGLLGEAPVGLAALLTLWLPAAATWRAAKFRIRTRGGRRRCTTGRERDDWALPEGSH